MKTITSILVLLVIVSNSYSQGHCLKVVKRDKKEFIIMTGQKIKINAPNHKGKIIFVKYRLTSVNKDSFIVTPLNKKFETEEYSNLTNINAIGFKTSGSVTLGLLHDMFQVAHLLLPTGFKSVYFMGVYKKVNLYKENWLYEIGDVKNYPNIRTNRITAKRIKL